ncbi:hypothetical protein MTO96_015871 [Rhipicephalus appendiculatus]
MPREECDRDYRRVFSSQRNIGSCEERGKHEILAASNTTPPCDGPLRCYDYGNAAVHASDDAGSLGNFLEGALLVRRPREVKPLADPGTHDYLRYNITHSLLNAGCMVTTVSPLPEEA